MATVSGVYVNGGAYNTNSFTVSGSGYQFWPNSFNPRRVPDKDWPEGKAYAMARIFAEHFYPAPPEPVRWDPSNTITVDGSSVWGNGSSNITVSGGSFISAGGGGGAGGGYAYGGGGGSSNAGSYTTTTAMPNYSGYTTANYKINVDGTVTLT